MTFFCKIIDVSYVCFMYYFQDKMEEKIEWQVKFVKGNANPFRVIGLFLYPLETVENQSSSHVFRGHTQTSNMKWVKWNKFLKNTLLCVSILLYKVIIAALYKYINISETLIEISRALSIHESNVYGRWHSWDIFVCSFLVFKEKYLI